MTEDTKFKQVADYIKNMPTFPYESVSVYRQYNDIVIDFGNGKGVTYTTDRNGKKHCYHRIENIAFSIDLGLDNTIKNMLFCENE